MRMNAGEREGREQHRKEMCGGKEGEAGGEGGQPKRSSEFPFTSVDKTAEIPLLRGPCSRSSFTGSEERARRRGLN